LNSGVISYKTCTGYTAPPRQVGPYCLDMIDLSAIKGQQQAVGILTGFLESGRAPHALVFSGPEGVGKRFAADLVARAVFCRSKGTVPCFECEACRRIEHAAFPDLISIGIAEDKTRILIDQIREIERIVAYHPFSGAERIIIIDPADLMTEDASAAILKTLEEPPAGTHFILVTSRAFSLPPTILSRCQKVRFSPLPRAVIAEILGGGDEAQEAAEAARGSLSRARSLISGGLVSAQGQMIGTLAEMELNDPVGIQGLFESITKYKVDIFDIIDILKCWYRDLIIDRETHREGDLVYHRLIKDFGGAWVRTSVASLIESMEAAEQIERILTSRMRLNMRIALEALFIRLVELKYNQ
jgi:DNA polymerase III subunit delta'